MDKPTVNTTERQKWSMTYTPFFSSTDTEVHFYRKSGQEKKNFSSLTTLFYFIWDATSLWHAFFSICHSYSWVLPSNDPKISCSFFNIIYLLFKIKNSKATSELSTTLNRLLICLTGSPPTVEIGPFLINIIHGYETWKICIRIRPWLNPCCKKYLKSIGRQMSFDIKFQQWWWNKDWSSI